MDTTPSVVSNVSFSDELKSINIDKWNKILSHKFIIEIAEDTLPIDKFVFYLKQDQIFLNSFCDLLAAPQDLHMINRQSHGLKA